MTRWEAIPSYVSMSKYINPDPNVFYVATFNRSTGKEVETCIVMPPNNAVMDALRDKQILLEARDENFLQSLQKLIDSPACEARNMVGNYWRDAVIEPAERRQIVTEVLRHATSGQLEELFGPQGVKYLNEVWRITAQAPGVPDDPDIQHIHL